MYLERKIKIYHIISSISRGGRERQLSTIVKNSDYHKFITRVIYFYNSDDSFCSEYALNEHLNKIESTLFIYRLFELHKTLANNKPDIVYTWGILESFLIILLKPFHSFKFINGSVRHGIRSVKIYHYLRTLLLHLSKNIVANSNAGLKVNSLTRGYVLYNGIENKFRSRLNNPEIKALRMKLIDNYNENIDFVYISVANLVPYKDYFTVLRALYRMKKKYSFYYFILGDGPKKDEIKKNIEMLGLEKSVILVGKTENVRAYLCASDIMIHSSRGEGTSNAILEGIYAGLPIVATNVGGIPETVYPSSSMLFPYKDHEALYRCLLKSKELKESFDPDSEEYQSHLRRFSVETMMRRFEEIINIVTKGKN